MDVRPILLLFALLLAGCAGPSLEKAPPGPFSIRPPVEGDAYTYEGNDGSRLEVTLGPASIRIDAFLERRPVLLMKIAYHPSSDVAPAEPFHFEEAIDAATGRIVQQAALCGLFGAVHQGPLACQDPSRVQVVFGASGLVGGFGAADLWADENRRNISLAPQQRVVLVAGQPVSSIDFDASAETHGGRACVRLSASGSAAHPGPLRAMPWTVIHGPLVLCDGLGLPFQFTTADLPYPGFMERTVSSLAYTLTSFRPASGRPLSAGAPSSGQTSPHVGFGEWRPPYYVDDPEEAFPFSTREAHEHALAHDDAYRAVFEQPSGMVVSSQYRWAANTSHAGEELEERHDRLLRVSRDDGTGLQVTIRKTVRHAEGQDSVQMSIRKVESIEPRPLPGVQERQVLISSVVALATNLTGLPPEKLIGGFWHKPLPHGWSLFLDASQAKSRALGYEAYVYLPCSAFGTVNVPCLVAVDGPTGALLQVDLPKDRYPP